MVVKSATKKKLMDMGIQEEFAHKLADDRKWDDVKILTPGEIAQICGLASDEATAIHSTLATFACRPPRLGRSWDRIGVPELLKNSFGTPK